VGRGPVQFTLDKVTAKILIEAKLARNRRFWNAVGSEKPTHQKAEGCNGAFIVVVSFDEKDFLERSKHCAALVGELKQEYRIKLVQVDAGHSDQDAWKTEPVVHIGDNITIGGDVNNSAVGSQASLVAEKIEVNVPADPTTHEI
jgi:hypothetical protein